MLPQFLLETFGVLIALFAIFCAYIKWTHGYWERNGIPYLPAAFPWGNLENPFKRREPFVFTFKKLYDECKKKGWDFAGMTALMSPQLVLVNPEVIRDVLTKDFSHFVDRGFYHNEEVDILTGHLFVMEGAKWKNLRAKLTPTFTSGKMKMMFETLVNCSKPLYEVLEAASTNNIPVDAKDVFACFTTDVIGSCAFGLECNSFKNPDSEFRKYSNRALKNSSRFRILKLLFATKFPKAAAQFNIKVTLQDVEDFFVNIVHATVRLRQNGTNNRKDFMQLLIQMLKDENNPDGITMNQIVAQSFLFFLAGFETSSTVGSFSLYELAVNQDVQQKAREEVETVLERHDGKLTYEGVHEMVYLGQVIDETLRKYPPLGILNRKCTKEYTIPGTKMTLEQGARIVVPLLGLHYDSDYFPEPEKFDPERFSEKNKGKIVPFSYMPFGEGPRNCIGLRFGIMQTKVGLAVMLRNFKFSLNAKTEKPLKMDPKSFLLSCCGGLWLDLEKI